MQVTLHAAAHIVQLCVSDVFELCEYHVVFKELIARLCREYMEFVGWLPFATCSPRCTGCFTSS
jgi:hypothetical protein